MNNSISHLAIIMDGNRRWAKKNALSFGSGYAQGGFGAIKRTVDFCLARGIKNLSLYTFSLENFKRPQEEQNFLFDTIVQEGHNNISYLQEKGVRVAFVGDRSLFPARVMPVCQEVEQATKECNKLFVQLLFCYGGRQELLSAVKKIVSQVQAGTLQPDEISEKTIQDSLWTFPIPDPELVIRTSGVQRLSNFLLFQSAYSEFYFLNCLWPEITEHDLARAVDAYEGVARNFGK